MGGVWWELPSADHPFRDEVRELGMACTDFLPLQYPPLWRKGFQSWQLEEAASSINRPRAELHLLSSLVDESSWLGSCLPLVQGRPGYPATLQLLLKPATTLQMCRPSRARTGTATSAGGATCRRGWRCRSWWPRSARWWVGSQNIWPGGASLPAYGTDQLR